MLSNHWAHFYASVGIGRSAPSSSKSSSAIRKATYTFGRLGKTSTSLVSCGGRRCCCCYCCALKRLQCPLQPQKYPNGNAKVKSPADLYYTCITTRRSMRHTWLVAHVVTYSYCKEIRKNCAGIIIRFNRSGKAKIVQYPRVEHDHVDIISTSHI